MRQRMALTSLPIPIDESFMHVGSTCKTTNYVYNLKYQVQNITQCGLEFLLFCYFLTGTLPTAAPSYEVHNTVQYRLYGVCGLQYNGSYGSYGSQFF